MLRKRYVVSFGSNGEQAGKVAGRSEFENINFVFFAACAVANEKIASSSNRTTMTEIQFARKLRSNQPSG